MLPKRKFAYFLKFCYTYLIKISGRKSGMGGNYQKDLYKQLMEVMAKVDSLEAG